MTPEGKKPTLRITSHGFKYYMCGSCGYELPSGKPKYCCECGNKVLWTKPEVLVQNGENNLNIVNNGTITMNL